MKSSLVLLAIVGSSLLVGIGCGKDDKGDKPSSAPSGDATGVADCDAYVTKMKACIDKLPSDRKAAKASAFKATRESFKSNGATPEGRAALESSCKALLAGFSQDTDCK
jgi:outer membrane murein-binding lipoprotein Lpp